MLDTISIRAASVVYRPGVEGAGGSFCSINGVFSNAPGTAKAGRTL